MQSILDEQCKPGAQALAQEEIDLLASSCPQWRIENKSLAREFKCKNYARTCALVAAVAEIAEAQNHHPQMSFGYNRCRVEWTTHSAGGLSRNDFICAARTDAAARRLSD